MKPVIAHPAIDHRIHGYGYLESGVRIDERHERLESVIRDPDGAHLAVAFRHVFHQPVDGVVSIGGVIHGSRILGPVHGAIHDVISLGAILAAHILDDPDVAILENHVGRVVIALQRGPQVTALRVDHQRLGVIGRAREQHAGMRRTLGYQNDRVQFDAVTHRDHHVAEHVVEGIADRRKVGRSFTGVGRVHGFRLVFGVESAVNSE